MPGTPYNNNKNLGIQQPSDLSNGKVTSVIRKPHSRAVGQSVNADFSIKTLTVEILKLIRSQNRAVKGLIIGHCILRKHLHSRVICRVGNKEEEAAFHTLFDCIALETWKGLTGLIRTSIMQ